MPQLPDNQMWTKADRELSPRGAFGARTFSFTITAPTRTSHFEAKFAGDKTATPSLRKSSGNVITITVKPSHWGVFLKSGRSHSLMAAMWTGGFVADG